MIRKNSVPNQNADNFLKLTQGETGCCGDTSIDCQGTATYTQSDSVSVLNIIENGVSKALPCVIAANATAATAKAAILATLIAGGYYDDDNEVWDGLVVTDLGSTVQVVITGDINLVSFTTSGGAVTFDNDCTVVGLCTFTATAFTAGAGSIAKINGVSRSIGDITPGTTSAATVKTSVESALTASGITGTTVTVTTNGSGGTQTYNIVIAGAPAGTTFYYVGASGVKFYAARSACAQYYV